MIRREDIEAEAAFIQSLMRPTGLDHTPTPWRKRADFGIESETGMSIAGFNRATDRDLALYFANAHAAIIGMTRQFANSFEFIARGSNDEAIRGFAANSAELAQSYADLFARLGKLPPEQT